MATSLAKSLAREIVLGEQAYKVVISPEGLRLTRKGARKGADLKWDAILALGEQSESARQPSRAPASDLPTATAADVAQEFAQRRTHSGERALCSRRPGQFPRRY